jgi:hypothetical protein
VHAIDQIISVDDVFETEPEEFCKGSYGIIMLVV